MKKHVQTLLLLVALLLPWAMNAQSLEDYTYSTGVDASRWITLTSYNDVSGSGSGDSWASSVQSIGFNFPFGEETYTQYSVNSDGNLRLGPTATGTGAYSTPFSSTNSNTSSPKINFFGCDGYLVSGTHYVHSQLFGDTLLVVEYCLGPYSTSYRNSLFNWQVHLYSNGNIECVYSSTVPASYAAAHQMGLCMNSTDGWIINSSLVATHFTSGSSINWTSTTVPAANTYFRFAAPVITCPKPLATLSALSANAATLAITAAGEETAWAYSITGSAEQVTTTNQVSLTGLTPSTTYTVSVRAICGAGDTSLARTFSFTTPCENVSLPYTNNFDDATTSTTAATGIYPSCWINVGPDGNAYSTATAPQIYYSSTYAHSGSYSMRLYNCGINTLPGIDNPRGAMLSFWVRQTAASYKLVVGVMDNPYDPSSFVAVDTISNTTTSASEYHEVYFDSYTGNGKYIAFHNYATTSYGYSYNYLDDISITALPTCVKVNTPVASTITTSSARIDWAPRDTAQNSFQVAYGTVNNIDSMTTVAAAANYINLSSLTDNTNYYVYVRAICGEGDTSDWSNSCSFKTPCNVAATPIFVEDFEGLTGDEMPDCWNQGWYYQHPTSGVKTQPFKSSTTYKHSGARAMTLQDQGTGTNSWASTGLMNIDRSSKYELSIWVYRQSASSYPNEGIALWLTSTVGDTTGAEFLGKINRNYTSAPVESATGWYNYTFPLNARGNRAIMIQGLSYYGSATYFDDVEIRELPCGGDVTYTENFEGQDANYTPMCWDITSSTTATATASNSQYVWGTYTYNGNSMMRLCNYWCQSGVAATKSPSIYIDTIRNYELVFDYSHNATCGNMFVSVSNDGGANFTQLGSYGTSNTGASSYTNPGSFLTETIDLSNYGGDTIILQFSTNANYGSGSIYVDNISFREINNCSIPTDVAVELTSASTAEVTFSRGDTTQNNFVVAYGTGLNPDVMDTVVVTDTVAILTGLTFETTYNVFVKAVCGEGAESYWSSYASVYTGYCTPNPTTVDGQGITRVQFGSTEENVDNSTRPTASPYYGNYSSMIGAVAASTIANVDIEYSTGYTYGTIIWVDWNKNLTFEGNEVVYVGQSASANPTTLNASFFVPATVDTGVYRMRIYGSDAAFDNYTGSIEAAAAVNPCASPYYAVAHDYSLRVTAAPSCMPLLGVAASNVTNSSADLTWTLVDTTQNSFLVAYGEGTNPDSLTQVTATTNSINLTGLTPATTYNVFVKAVCGTNDESTWATTSFTTDLCAAEDQCIVVLSMTDQYNDGWNGASLALVDSLTNITVGTAALANGIALGLDTFAVCPGRIYNLVWSSGYYDSECAFTLTNVAGNQIYASSSLSAGILTSFEAVCINSYNVTLAVNDTTMGTVTGGGIYNEGDTATLIATPNAGYQFISWNDGDSNATRAIVVMSDTTFTATFAALPDTVNIIATNYDVEYYSSDNDWYVELADSNYAFYFDIVADSLVNGQTYTLNNMLADYTGGMVLADYSTITFTAAEYVQTIANSRIDIHAVATATDGTIYNINFSDTILVDTVVLSMPLFVSNYDAVDGFNADFANADTTVIFEFVMENAPVNGVVYSDPDVTAQMVDYNTYDFFTSTRATYTQNIVNHVFSVQATALMGNTYYILNYSETLIPDSVNITVTAADPTMGTVTGAGRYEVDQNVTISAVANDGYHFVVWNDDDTNATRTFVATVDAAYIATFAPNMYTVTLDVNDATMGTVTGAGEYAYNTQVTLSATPNAGYRFVSWSNGETTPTITITVTEDVTLTANFEVGSYIVTVNVNDATMGTVTGAGEYVYGAEATLTATANEGYHFVNWSNGETTATITFTVTEDVTLTANFASDQEGIDNVDLSDLKVYPNPTMGMVTISVDNVTKVEVLDLVGRMVVAVEGSNMIDLSTLSNGVYTLRITTTEGIAVRKVVKK